MGAMVFVERPVRREPSFLSGRSGTCGKAEKGVAWAGGLFRFSTKSALIPNPLDFRMTQKKMLTGTTLNLLHLDYKTGVSRLVLNLFQDFLLFALRDL